MRLVLPIAVVVTLAGLPPMAGAQGLGDASKKEKERREQGKSTGTKTYTQEELSELPPVAGGPASPASAAGPRVPAGAAALVPGSRGPSTISEDDGRRVQENTWRSRVAAAQARVDTARTRHERLAGMYLVPGYEYQDARGRTVIGSIGQLQQLTAAAKADLDAAEKALADHLEEARRANVPPGWLR